MNWTRLALITIGAGIVTSLTDGFLQVIGSIVAIHTQKSGGKETKPRPLL